MAPPQREQAWQTFPYPCIGQFRFLDLSIGLHPLYPEVLQRMKSGSQIYLDLGCCFGQDIRRLVSDGAPSKNCYGSDLRLDFMSLGYNLFLDKDKLESKFIQGDVFDPDSELKTLDGNVDIIHAASFFHLFGLEEQKQVARRIVKLLKPRQGSLVLGRQVGNVQGGEFLHRTNPNRMMFRHDKETWKRMWDEVGEETGSRWDVHVDLLDWPGFVEQRPGNEWQQDGARRLQFAVRRTE